MWFRCLTLQTKDGAKPFSSNDASNVNEVNDDAEWASSVSGEEVASDVSSEATTVPDDSTTTEETAPQQPHKMHMPNGADSINKEEVPPVPTVTMETSVPASTITVETALPTMINQQTPISNPNILTANQQHMDAASNAPTAHILPSVWTMGCVYIMVFLAHAF